MQYRPPYDGRRECQMRCYFSSIYESDRSIGGGGYGSHHRHENEHNETSCFTRAPPKNTLMDFMKSLKISAEISRMISDEENLKSKEITQPDRRRNEHPSQFAKEANGAVLGNEMVSSTSTPTFSDQMINNETNDSEEDANYNAHRERRNQLPPR
jgi:hypothetical protein